MIRSVADDYEEIRSEDMSGTNAAYAALISNGTEQKDVEQLDDILRTFINETSKLENRFGKIRDEEQMLAVKN